MSEPESLFAADDRRRALAESLRDQSDATGALLAQRDQDRATRAQEGREARQQERAAQARGDAVRVAINAPHRATVSGRNIALTIDNQGGGAGGGEAPAGYTKIRARMVVESAGGVTPLVVVHEVEFLGKLID